jgi:hypothetical integral membrane protein (TIGR02206 family)
VACLFALANQLPTPDFDAMRDFRAFTAVHVLALLTFAAGMTIILWLGVRWRGTPRQRAFEQTLGLAGLAIWLAANIHGFLPAVFDWNWALPLQVCDLCELFAPVALLLAVPPAWLRGLLYFWGIALCTQAFITPTLREGPADPRFWFFWSAHFVILIGALYELFVRRWRPTWRHWRIAVAASVAYLMAILPIDIAFDWNYGFVGRETKADTMIEVLGPWPARVAIIFALAVLAYTALMLPWAFSGGRDQGRRARVQPRTD